MIRRLPRPMDDQWQFPAHGKCLEADGAVLGISSCSFQVAEAALADEWVRTGDRTSLQRRVLRLGKPPRRWRQPAWANPACAALWQPKEVKIQVKDWNVEHSLGVPTCSFSCREDPASPVPGCLRVVESTSSGRTRHQPLGPNLCVVGCQGRPIKRLTGLKSAFWGFDDQVTNVEGLVLQFYAQEDNGVGSP